MASRASYLVRLGWRDLWRNRRRTILVGTSMLFSAFIMVFAVGMNSGLVDDMARTVTGSFLGHAQVQSPDYITHPNLEHALTGDQTAALAARFAQVAEVKAFSPRLVSGGLMNKKVPDPLDEEDLAAWKSMTSQGVMLLGIDPTREHTVSNLHASVVPDVPRLRCLRGCAAGLAELYLTPDKTCLELCPEAQDDFGGADCRLGCQAVCANRCAPDDDLCEEGLCEERCLDYCEPARFLAGSNPFAGEDYRGEVVLGADLAQVLRTGVGDRVALTIGTADGRVFGAIYRVCGLLETTQTALNGTLALTHIGALSQGVGVPGGATAMVLKFADFEAAQGLAGAVQRQLDSGDSAGAVRVRSWGELAPDVETFIRLKLGGTYVLMLVFTLIVAVIVANVVTMSVLERTREYGVRLALGESANRLMGSVLVESVLLALLFGGLGTGLGVVLVEYYARAGLDMGMGQVETAGVVLTGILYPRNTFAAILFALCSVLAFSVAGSVYPALRIRRIRVMDALHFS